MSTKFEKLFEQGIRLFQTGQLQAALKLWQQLQRKCQETGNRCQEANVLNAALHNGAMKSGKKQCSVQNVVRLISVKMGSKKVNKITFVRNADASFLVPILSLLDTRMSLSVSA